MLVAVVAVVGVAAAAVSVADSVAEGTESVRVDQIGTGANRTIEQTRVDILLAQLGLDCTPGTVRCVGNAEAGGTCHHSSNTSE